MILRRALLSRPSLFHAEITHFSLKSPCNLPAAHSRLTATGHNWPIGTTAKIGESDMAFLINNTWGSDDLEKATIAFVVGNASAARGDARVFLANGGTDLRFAARRMAGRPMATRRCGS